MNINFIYDNVLEASQFAEYLSGACFMHCDTYREFYRCLSSRGIHIHEGYTFTSSRNLNPDTPCVIVRFSREEDYAEHEYRIIPVPKRYLTRLLRNLAEDREVTAVFKEI